MNRARCFNTGLAACSGADATFAMKNEAFEMKNAAFN